MVQLDMGECMGVYIAAGILGFLSALPIMWIMVHLHSKTREEQTDIPTQTSAKYQWRDYIPGTPISASHMVQVVYVSGVGKVGMRDDIDWHHVTSYRIIRDYCDDIA